MARRTSFAAINVGNSFCPLALGSAQKGRVDAAVDRRAMHERFAFTSSSGTADCFIHTGDAELIAWAS